MFRWFSWATFCKFFPFIQYMPVFEWEQTYPGLCITMWLLWITLDLVKSLLQAKQTISSLHCTKKQPNSITSAACQERFFLYSLLMPTQPNKFGCNNRSIHTRTLIFEIRVNSPDYSSLTILASRVGLIFFFTFLMAVLYIFNSYICLQQLAD